MLREWTEGARPLYYSMDLGHEEEHTTLKATEQHRQKGLEEARAIGAHYLLVNTVVVVVVVVVVGFILLFTISG